MPAGRATWVALGALALAVVTVTVALLGLARPSSVTAFAPVAWTLPPPVEAPPAATSDPTGTTAGAPIPRPAPTWTARVAAATGIPARAVQAYATAQLVLDGRDPGCGLGWNTLAGIGAVESDHGRHDGSTIGADGIDRPTVLGPPLDGTAGNKAVPDTDGGKLDGDTTWDRAVGPLQFIPSTWAQWGRSLSGGVPDPDDIDDAALTAATYLCASGDDMATTAGWNAAIGTYNEPVEYAVDVAGYANEYAARSTP